MFLYEHEGGAYLNVTNRCPVACAFCVKTDWGRQFRGSDLDLKGREPSLEDVLIALNERLHRSPPPKEFVFCGFGEPTFRLDVIEAVGRWARESGRKIPVRLNTVGLGNLIHSRDIVPDLARGVDAVSVSLNTGDPEQWMVIHRPAPAYRAGGFAAAREFARLCAVGGLRTRVTAVERSDVDLGPLRAYAASIGAEFLARPALG